MYDVTIIGAGVSSIFMAYSLAKSNKKVLILDKGKALEDRHCPLDEGKVCTCTTCDKYFGFGGLGKSEGNLIIQTDLAENLSKKSVKKALFNSWLK